VVVAALYARRAEEALGFRVSGVDPQPANGNGPPPMASTAPGARERATEPFPHLDG
jgi:hypothetical protein